MNTLGIDIGGTSTKAALLRDGVVLSLGRSGAYQRPDAESIAEAVRTAGEEALRGARADVVGLCLPGAWDEQRGIVTKSVNVPGLEGVGPAALLAAAGISSSGVRTFTDAHAAAHDVFVLESMTERLLAVSIGTGVGAAVLNGDGRQLLINGRSSGHLGQVDVTVSEPGREPPIGPDGGRGGLEAYIGLPALRARYGGTPVELVSRIGPDDAPLVALAQALRIAHAIYRPRHVRLLGGVGLRLVPMLTSIRARVSDGLTSLARPDWTLACGTSDHHAACGAARLAAGND